MAYQGTSPQIGTRRKLDPIAFNGSASSFILTSGGLQVYPATPMALLISINGALQEPNGAFTISGSTINFASAPSAGSSFFGVVLGEKVALADMVPATGGAMSGHLTLSANPTSAMHAATKQYVDSGSSGATATANAAQSTANSAVSAASTARPSSATCPRTRTYSG